MPFFVKTKKPKKTKDTPPLNDNPNFKPGAFVALMAAMQVVTTMGSCNVLFAQDNSGSQGPMVRFLTKQLSCLCSFSGCIFATLFGSSIVKGVFGSIASLMDRFDLQEATYTADVVNLIKEKGPLGPFILVVQGDGSFTNPSSFYSGLDSLASEGKLTNLRKVVFVFTPGTFDRVKSEIKASLEEVLAKCPNTIELEFRDLFVGAGDDQLKIIVEDVVSNTSSATLPEGWLSFFGLVAFHGDLTARNIVSTDVFQKAARKLMFLMLKTVKEHPKVLLNSPALMRLHLCLKIMYPGQESEYIRAINTIKNSFRKGTPEEQALTEFLRSSFEDPAEAKWKADQLAGLKIGSLKLGYNTTAADITSAIRDGSAFLLVSLLTSLMRTASFVHGGAAKGMSVLKKTCTPDQARTAVSSLFSQFGNFNLSGIKLFITVLTMLGSEAQVPSIVFDMLIKSLEGMKIEEYFGFNSETNTFQPDSIWGSYHMAVLGYASLVVWGSKLLPNKEKLCENLIGAFRGFIRVHEAAHMARVKVSHTFETQIPVGHYAVGDLVLLAPYERDPQINLPSMGVIERIFKKRGISHAEVLYLDRADGKTESGSLDTIRLPISTLTVMCSADTLSSHLKNLVTVKLVKMQEDGTAGLLGDAMKRGAPRDDAILANNIDAFKALIAEHGGQPMAFETVQRTVQIPRDIIARVVAAMVAANDECLSLLLSGNRVNYTDSIVCAPHGDADCNIPNTFVVDGCVIELNDELIHLIETEAKDSLKQINLNKLNASSMRTCSCCADSIHERHCVKLVCEHFICKECFTGMMPLYEPGDFIDLCRHRCPLCRHTIEYTKNAPWTGQLNELLKSPDDLEYRICSHGECSCIFGERLDCGATRDNLPEMCIAHRPEEIVIKQCPRCGIETEKNGGCNHMTCANCDHQYCWECLTRWPDEADIEHEVDPDVNRHDGQYYNCPIRE